MHQAGEKIGRKLSRWLRPDVTTIVGCSGGADSTLLARTVAEIHPGPIVLAHVNYGRRGLDSVGDEAFVRELAAALKSAGGNVQFETIQADAFPSGNFEAQARRFRYDWWTQLAAEEDRAIVVTGHTANDQAETVLFRMIRGAGLQGMTGITRKTVWHGPHENVLRVVRPLLDVSRKEVLDALKQLGQEFRTDATNAHREFARNRIRHDVLPALEAVNSQAIRHLCRLAHQAARANRAQLRQCRQLLMHIEKPKAGATCVLALEPLSALPRRLLSSLFYFIWKREGWPRARMGRKEFNRLFEVVTARQRAVDLPAGIRAVRHERVVVVGPAG